VTEPTFTSETARIREPGLLVRWGGPAALGAVAVAALLGGKALLPMLPVLTILAVVATMALRRSVFGHHETPGRITADGRGILRDGALVVPREKIRQGFVLAGIGTWLVRFDHGFGRRRTEIAVSSVEEGRALLKTLGLDASQTVATVRGMSRVLGASRWKMIPLAFIPVVTAVAGGFLTRATGAPHMASILMPLLVIAMASVFLIPTTIRVGADGILTRWAGSERFYSYRDIERVTQFEASFGSRKDIGLELGLRNGQSVRLAVREKQLNAQESNLLFERVREAIEVYREGAAGIDASALARSGRETSDWIRTLKSIGAGAGADMRTASVPVERLLGLVLDSTARAIDRASAAVALTPVLADDERTRIRVAAEAAASPKLRVALEKASAGADDDALAEALSELEADEAKREEA